MRNHGFNVLYLKTDVAKRIAAISPPPFLQLEEFYLSSPLTELPFFDVEPIDGKGLVRKFNAEGLLVKCGCFFIVVDGLSK